MSPSIPPVGTARARGTCTDRVSSPGASAGVSGAEDRYLGTAGAERERRARDLVNAGGPRRVADGPARVNGESRWWTPANREMEVKIDGHDFDFKPKQNLGNGRVKGEVDGPLNHNGTYEVSENQGDRLTVGVKVGTDDAHTNDLDVTMKIAGGRATVTGSVKGKALPAEGVSGDVAGAGTKQDPFRISFRDADGNDHTIKWRPE